LRQDPGRGAESSAGPKVAETGCGMTERYVLGFQDIDETQVAVVGGKGAHLGALSRIDGIHVPAGFCVTTAAFRQAMADAPATDDLLAPLSPLDPADREGAR